MALLCGDFNKPGPYLVMMRWNPGWFSAPYTYATDRICVVVSGTCMSTVGTISFPATPFLWGQGDM